MLDEEVKPANTWKMACVLFTIIVIIGAFGAAFVGMLFAMNESCGNQSRIAASIIILIAWTFMIEAASVVIYSVVCYFLKKE